MNKITILTSALVLGLATTGVVSAADSIIFDPDGTGGDSAIVVGAFDWTPDNAISLQSVPLIQDDIIDVYLQAQLGNFVKPNCSPPDSCVITGTGLNTNYEITFQSGFTEDVVTSLETLGVGNTANFLLADAGDQNVNFFNVYWDDSIDANPETGAGYGDGTLIMTAVITAQTTTFFVPYTQDLCTGSCTGGIFIPDGTLDTPTISALDQSPDGDQQPGVGTVEGAGGGTLDASVTTQNTDFFLDPITQQIILELFFNSSQVVPFQQIDPTGPITCTAGVVGNCANLSGGVFGFDLVNGLATTCTDVNGCDFLFQADANQSFAAEQVRVPEPSTIALLGLGLGALGVASRRRRRQS